MCSVKGLCGCFGGALSASLLQQILVNTMFNITSWICIFHYITHFEPFSACHVTVHGDSGIPYSINHQKAPTASFHHGHCLFTFIKDSLAFKQSHQEKVHEEQTLAVVIIMFGSILCLFPLNWNSLK